MSMDPRSSSQTSFFTQEGPPPPQIPENPEVTHHQPQASAVHDLDQLLRGLSNPPQPSSTVSLNTQLPDTSATTQPAHQQQESHTDKQNALLNNLMNPAAFPSQSKPQPEEQQRTNASPQSISGQEGGKQLLEQLLSGQPENRPLYTTQYSYSQQHLSSSSEIEASPYGSSLQSSEPINLQQWPQPPQQPPSPRKSMFEFVSPFDVLGPNVSQAPPTQSTASKKKPVPALNASASPSDESGLSAEERRNRDPKRQSVENLLGEQTKNLPAVSQTQIPSQPLESYALPEAFPPPPPAEQQPRALPPKPSGPRNDSPKTSPRARNRQPVVDPNAPPPQTLATVQQSVGRQRDGSPAPRRRGPGGKKASPPTSSSGTIIFDVSQSLETTMAPQNSVKSTAIALVKIESSFLHGSTIAATSWIAYAMTKGRVRVISRSSGDRTLLQLPSYFPQHSSIVDMVVSGNRLAGVTSDGGFVVWELPTIIEDDVSARLLVCVQPAQGPHQGLKSVKWHPKQPDTLAVASESRVHLVNVDEVYKIYQGDVLSQMEFSKIGHSLAITSPVVNFAFDVTHSAIATISENSMLTLWNIRDKTPIWEHKVMGEGTPSSIDFLDGGIVIGRKNGTIFQLLAVMGRDVLSTIKFVNGDREDPEMFGHVAYDSRIRTLWVANSKRESLIAIRVNLEAPTVLPSGEDGTRGSFEQVVEFTGPKASIQFVILTQDTDPNGEEAHAACVAAKLPPGELALVAFVVHCTGVDQVLIRKEWFDRALLDAPDKFPYPNNQPQFIGPQPPPPQRSIPIVAPVPLRHTPPAEELEIEAAKEEAARNEARGKAGKGRGGAPAFKDPEREFIKDGPKDKGKETEKAVVKSTTETGAATDSSSIVKEIRKTEDILHTKISRHITKELDKQQHRLEEIRQAEQRNEFERQQTILKLISTELTKNTTRVVESAVKNEVQQSVLPSLERITKEEVKAALNNHISKGLTESMQQTLPLEVERLLLRPDVSNHVARTFSAAVTPLIEKHVKDAITTTLIPAYQQLSSSMHQELSREFHSEIITLRKEIITWQSEALRSQEGIIRDMEHTLRTLSDQVKLLSMNFSIGASQPHGHHQVRVPASPPGSSGSMGHPPLPVHMRQPVGPQMQSYPGGGGVYDRQPPAQAQGWYQQPSMTNQPTPPSTSTQAVNLPTSSSKADEWEEIFMTVLTGQDLRQLQELLARSNPEVILPSNGKAPLSQAVILTLVHRLSSLVNERTPGDEVYKTSLWWLNRAAGSLNPNDEVISSYISRLMPTIQQALTTARQRLILPGLSGHHADTSHAIHDIQEILGRKALPGGP